MVNFSLVSLTSKKLSIQFGMMNFLKNFANTTLKESVDLLKKIYSKTKCCTNVSDKRTEYFDYCETERQGRILYPVLSNLY